MRPPLDGDGRPLRPQDAGVLTDDEARAVAAKWQTAPSYRSDVHEGSCIVPSRA
jgi:hypothetical protein